MYMCYHSYVVLIEQNTHIRKVDYAFMINFHVHIAKTHRNFFKDRLLMILLERI